MRLALRLPLGRVLALLALALLTACGGGGSSRPRSGVPGYYSTGNYLSCVPYARQRSGIELSGDAWRWWSEAAGRYDRTKQPERGAVMVLARTRKLPSGHLSVVTRVVSSREILVDHANWASGRGRGEVARNQPVVDVSPGNDWTMVRVWFPPIDSLGTSRYPVDGFILPFSRTASR